MARPWFKRVLGKVIPSAIERSTYVACASLVLILLFWQWKAMPWRVWEVTAVGPSVALRVISAGGWLLVLVSTFALSRFELFGLKQVYARLKGATLPAGEFRLPALYRMVRHPIYLGFLLAFWATPVMTLGH